MFSASMEAVASNACGVRGWRIGSARLSWGGMMSDPLIETMQTVEGMTGTNSAIIFRGLLKAQSCSGPILEIGCYKGRSALVLALCARDGERVFIMDPEDRVTWDAFGSVRDRVHFLEGYSENLASIMPDYEALAGTFRFVHDDASHQFENVLCNMRYADKLLAPEGILSIDDYENPNYAQVPFAVGAAIFREGLDFRPFLIADNKAYFCRAAHWPVMMRAIVKDLLPETRLAGLSLARTDGSEFSPYNIRPGNVSDEGGMYGVGLYRHFLTGWLD